MPRTLTPHPARRYQRLPARWAERASYYIGRAPATVEALIHGSEAIHERVGHIIRSLVATGDGATLAKVLAPIEAATQSLPAESMTPELIQLAQRDDVLEEVAETRYLSCATATNLKAWRQALEAQRATSLRLYRAIVSEEAK